MKAFLVDQFDFASAISVLLGRFVKSFNLCIFDEQLLAVIEAACFHFLPLYVLFRSALEWDH